MNPSSIRPVSRARTSASGSVQGAATKTISSSLSVRTSRSAWFRGGMITTARSASPRRIQSIMTAQKEFRRLRDTEGKFLR